MNSESLTYLRLDFEIAVPYAVVLKGIEAWFEWDLISELDLRWRNTRLQGNRLIVVAKLNDNILLGLDLWLQMGLLTDEYVRLLGRTRFSRDLPTFSEATSVRTHPTEASMQSLTQDLPELEPTRSTSNVSTRNSPPPSPRPVVPVHHPSRSAQMVQSLISEFSTIWLLFLGVFLVVVSSGVLAASQWNQFPPQGQFAILLGYTLAFWVVSLWTGRQEKLSLTTRTLEILTLLVIPVNFWAIDGFQLLSNSVGLIESAIAAVMLSGITLLLLKQQVASKLTALNCVGLSLLHIGWGIAGYPLIAVYIGTVGTSLIFFWQQKEREASDRTKLSLGEITIAYTTLILLFRAIFIAGVSITDLGLALGICGWMASKLNRRQNAEGKDPQPQFPIAAGLLLLGWGVSVGAQFPWQAVAVSILALFLLFERLQRHWQGIDLAAIFAIALQTFCLAFQLLPLQMRTDVVNWGMSLARIDTPLPLLGIVIFPYVILSLFLSDRLRRSERHSLAKLGETLSLGLGVLLSCLSFLSPVTRSLNLGLSFVTLFAVTIRRDRAVKELIYFTHIVGLGAISSIGDFCFPNLKLWDWGMLSLGLAIVEWGFSALLQLNSPRLQIWRQSAWALGTLLAGLSYLLLIQGFRDSTLLTRSMIWAIVPLTLTILGYIRNFPQASSSTSLSILSLFLLQALTFPQMETRAIGLGIGFVLMLVNTLKRQELGEAAIAVGFGVSLVGSLLWQFSSHYELIDRFNLLMNSAGITAIVLLAIRHGLRHQASNPNSDPNSDRILPKIYSRVLDGWATALVIPVYIFLTFWVITNYTFHHFLPNGFLSATCLITLTMLYRSIFEAKGWAIYFVGGGLELLTYATVSLMQGSLTAFAIANIALGLASQLFGDLWLARKGWARFPQAWHVLPLVFGFLGTLLRLHVFTDWTGFVTLGTSAIAIGIGRRQPEWKGLTYLGIVGITLAIYELLIYQLSLSTGGSIGDGLVLMAIAATAIAIVYRLLSSLLIPYLRLERRELRIIGNIHWFMGVGLTIFASFLLPSQFGGVLGTCAALVLTIYALVSGRDRADLAAAEFWVYAGISMAIVTGIYLLYFAFPDSLFIVNILRPYAATIACFVCIPIQLAPWDAWGWSNKPWHRSAIVLPCLSVITTAISISIPSLFIVAAFYSWVARVKNSIRISYVSLILVNWALMQFYHQHQLTNSLWYVATLGFSLLYVVQVDPSLSAPEAREQRHMLRLLGTGSICASAAIQSPDNLGMAWVAIGIGLAFILAGLTLRVRSYLYVGTIAFITVILIQVSIFVTKYSLLIWALGIFAGIVFIWIAANFEARRDRILALIRDIATELQAWE
ncbi:hypothetical protein V2H45_12240 [Tumidithrix elongata RA019]|uniref:DUF2157 domain-containing protein n=1 Tax=Tumidithrix elongata BACA0141 TaxID=2716417 RepID=A0AAW9Q101_9CYAN|nr:hypothetical protein [Tumidithrix elongata RA019]